MSIVSMRKWMHNRGLVRFIMLAMAVVMAVGIAYMGLGGLGNKPQDGTQDDSQPMAKVDGETLTRGTFNQLYTTALLSATGSSNQGTDNANEAEQILGPIQAEQLRGRVLEQAITQILITHAAKREGINVSNADINNAIDQEVNKQISIARSQILANYKGKDPDKAFMNGLKSHGLTLDMIRSDVQKNLESHKDQIVQSLMAQKLMDKMKSGIDTSDKAVRASYDQVSYGRILVSTAKRSDAQAEQIANTVSDKLKKGGDFASLAKQYSDDPMKASGGIVPAMPVAYIQNDILDALAKLKPGETSDPVKTSDGYMIVKLISRESKLPADYNNPQKQKQYKDSYVQMAMLKAQAQLMSEIHKGSKIDILDPEMKAYSSLMNPTSSDQKATILKAISEYKTAVNDGNASDSQSLARSFAELAMLYAQMSQPQLSPKKEDQANYRKEEKRALEGGLQNTESSELRMMLAQLKIQDKDYAGAVNDLSYVDANAYNDPSAHQQLLNFYKEMKAGGYAKADALIAGEKKWLADNKQQTAAQQTSSEPSAAAPVKAASKP